MPQLTDEAFVQTTAQAHSLEAERCCRVMRGVCLLPDEGGQHLFRKQPHLPIDLIDALVAEQPYIPKGAHQMV